MIKTAPRISKQAAEFLPEYFRSLNAGCEHVLNSWPGLFRLTLEEIRGRFSEGELSIMLDVMNATFITPENYGRHLIMNCQDGVNLDKLDEKWHIEKEIFFDKIQQLNTFQATCLEIWANGFWYSQKSAKDGLEDIKEYVSKLT